MSQMPSNFRLEQAQYRLGTAISDLTMLIAIQPNPGKVIEWMPRINLEIQESIKLLDSYVQKVTEALPCPY